MKKRFAIALTLILLIVCSLATSVAEDATAGATPANNAAYDSEGIMKTLGKERVFTRSGPGTEFRDTGTYTVEGGLVRVYSCAYDNSGECWVQCDFTYREQLRRLYTRLEDIDADYFDAGDIYIEEPLGYKAKVVAVTKLLYGPGEEYGTYGNSFKSSKGATVYITAIEGDYAQVEWTTKKQSYRVWVPTDILKY